VAEAGATKSINEVKESRLVANAKVALRACCDQDWKQEKGERGNAETLQKLTQVFDMLSHYTIPTARRDMTFNSRTDDIRAVPPEGQRMAPRSGRCAIRPPSPGRLSRFACCCVPAEHLPASSNPAFHPPPSAPRAGGLVA
jgi:hypothetical protein